MNQWFERPSEAQSWTSDPGIRTRQSGRQGGTLANAVITCILATIVVFLLGMAFTNRGDLPRFYPTCDWARLAGAAPIARTEKGYRQALDADNDGLACEPYQDF